MTTEAVCQHHWILEATGNDAMGVCKKCKVSRLHQGSELFIAAFGGETLDKRKERVAAIKRGSSNGGQAIKHFWKGD
jgi:hypothetical protein